MASGAGDFWRRWNPAALWARRRARAERDAHFRSGLVKVMFDLKDGPFAVDEPPYAAEWMWAKPEAEEGRFQLMNSPFHVRGVSWCDVVAAEVVDDCLTVTRVVERGGHSTVWVLLEEGKSIDDWEAAWGPLEAQGCGYEGDGERLIVLDAPPEADVDEVFRLLGEGERLGVWSFEEAHRGRPR